MNLLRGSFHGLDIR